MRKFLLVSLVFFFVFTYGVANGASIRFVSQDGNTRASLNGYVKNGNKYVSLPQLFRVLDYEIHWDPTGEQYVITQSNQRYVLQVGSNRALVDGQRLVRIGSVIRRNNQVYVPVSGVIDLLNNNSNERFLWNPTRSQIQHRSENQSKNEDPMQSLLKKSMPQPRQIEPDTSQKSKKDQFLVMIDPGHGGRDPGAISQGGLMEKTVVLNLSKRLKRTIERKFDNIEAMMTRKTDRFIPLEKRTEIANKHNADLFISIHANSNRSSEASGFSVFTLGGDASDHLAAELAKVENSALRYEGYDKKELNQVQWILAQLMKTVNTRDSRKIARLMVKQFKNRLSIPNRGVRKAPFWVLKDAGMPSVLVESGFLSNPNEVKKLRAEDYQNRVARGIAEAIKKYRKRTERGSQTYLTAN